MGVHGLWKLLEPAGKPIPLETLENHILAVDVSIWLHQLLKGFQDGAGSSLPNAHLLGLFHRVCKLLFFRIKPVFVFDGGVPALKRRTIVARQQQKSKAEVQAEKSRQQLLKNLLKQKAVGQVLEELRTSPVKAGPSKAQDQADLFELPPMLIEGEQSESDIDNDTGHISNDSTSSEDDLKRRKYKDVHSIDVHSNEFKGLPADIRHDILTELKETRKQSSWGRIHEMPEDLGQFSNFQMNRLLKRRSVQVSLEEAEKEMGGRTLSLGDVEVLLQEQGIDTKGNVGSRIASDNITRYLYVTGDEKFDELKKEDVTKKNNEQEDKSGEKTDVEISTENAASNKVEASVKLEETEKKPSTSDAIENTELPLYERYEEFKFGSDTSSVEVIPEDIEEDFVIGSSVIENCGVSQEQILSIIKDQNKFQMHANESKNIKEDSNSLNEDTKQDSIIRNEAIGDVNCTKETKLQCKNKNKIVHFEKDIVTQSTKNKLELQNVSLESSTLDISSNSPLPGSSIDSTKTQSTKNKPDLHNIKNSATSHIASISSLHDSNIGTTNKEQMNQSEDKQITSESESEDDLIAIEDTPVKSNTKEDTKTKFTFEVTINTKDKMNNSDDIFAGVFDDHDKIPSVEDIKEIERKSVHDVEFMSSESSSSVESNEDEGSVTEEKAEEEVERDKSKRETAESESSALERSDYFKARGNLENKEEKIEDEDIESSRNEESIEEVKACSSNVNDEPVSEVRTEERKGKKKLSTKELQKLQTILEDQESNLQQTVGREERLAANVTEQIRLEAQELLQLFGVPWVMAPMEAEAQCAFLDRIGLTHGSITDDSDIWLFGAKKVYKNFFNQKKFVKEFQDKDIQHFFKLSRGDLVELALLVGSDYTVGVTGVGPVTALEIIAMFRPPSDTDSGVLATLTAFKEWLRHPSNTGSPLAKKLKDVQLDDGFPNRDVVEAYLNPNVDESEERFSWGTPDLAGLREFCKRKFGWNQNRVDEILLPVMKKLQLQTSQTKIDSFFQRMPSIPVYKEKVSKRVQRAIHRLGGQTEEDLELFRTAAGSSSRGNRIRSQTRGRARGRGRGSQQPISVELPPSTEPPLSPPPAKEIIPQRERTKLEAMKRKMEAIEILKRGKKSKNARKRPPKAPIKNEANLSESSSDEA